MLPPEPWYGLAKITRRNGESVVACLDMAGMIYGVVVSISFAADEHPADFDEGEIVACKVLNEGWQRFLLSDWCPRRAPDSRRSACCGLAKGAPERYG
jgi:hypothetical protein